jgi:hypothetical protein
LNRESRPLRAGAPNSSGERWRYTSLMQLILRLIEELPADLLALLEKLPEDAQDRYRLPQARRKRFSPGEARGSG